MALALFDLDNTLIAGDSDYLWGRFLVELGIVDAENHESENKRFYQEYKDGCLDIEEFLAFSLRPLKEHSIQQLIAWQKDFLTRYIVPIMLPAAKTLIEQHRAQGDTLIIVTATNAFITAPIAKLFGIEHLLATIPEQQNGRYTGKVLGSPCFQQGKITHLKNWAKQRHDSMQGSFFYSDSHNDIPLLELVTYPIAVDPDPNLLNYAQTHNWQIISLRTAVHNV